MWRWTLRVLMGLGGLIVLAGLAAAGILAFGRPQVRFSHSATALTDISVDGLDARLSNVQATLGTKPVPLTIIADRLVPSTDLPAGALVDVRATTSSPSWLTWLLGPSTSSSVIVRTPLVQPASNVAITTTPQAAGLSSANSVREAIVRFSAPVSVIAYRAAGSTANTRVDHIQPPSAVARIPVPPSAAGGMLEVSAAARSWEVLPQADHSVTWFALAQGSPPGVVADPGPFGTAATSTSPISLVFSETVADTLGTSRPTISPSLNGAWSEPTSHELVFTPSGFGYGPGEMVTVGFDRTLSVVATGASASTQARTVTSYSFTVQPGSILRLDQLLAQLRYMPLRFTPAAGTATPTTLAAEEATIYSTLAGSFAWRYGSVPPALASQWSPGQPTVMLKGALMAFEAATGNYDYTMDHESVAQIANRATWKALLEAALASKVDPNPYSYVYVTKTLPETLTLWEDGQVVLTSPTNTGIPQDPTADGTYPIYLRYVQNYMSGTNPNGTTYHDLVHWINYFNGSDAVHGFVRAAYGFPQSLGCAELPVPTAAKAFTYLAIGDLVTIAN